LTMVVISSDTIISRCNNLARRFSKLGSDVFRRFRVILLLGIIDDNSNEVVVFKKVFFTSCPLRRPVGSKFLVLRYS